MPFALLTVRSIYELEILLMALLLSGKLLLTDRMKLGPAVLNATYWCSKVSLNDFSVKAPGANFIVLENGKQIFVLTSRNICLSVSVFHRLARKLG